MNKNFRTIKQTGKWSQVIKKSEFICALARVETEKEALDFIGQISEQHHKAHHNCSAYLIGQNDEIQHASDNGEPSGTAGVPILNALKQNGLHNVVAVVTRYFGGIKLGTGGLIRAYNGTTAQAIQEVGIVERVSKNIVKFTCDYHLFEKIKYFLAQHEIVIDDVAYTSEIKLSVLLAHDKVETFEHELNNYLNTSLTYSIGQQIYVDCPVKTNFD